MYSYVVFRMDDICPQMNYNKFMRFKLLFDKYNIKPVIGIVPDNRDPKLAVSETDKNFWNMIKDLYKDGWVIAQHGYQHIYATKAKGLVAFRNLSEFAGLPFEKQYSMIKEGKEILSRHGLDINTFMAPGHSYDKTTLAALKKCGFRYVTDGLSNYPYEYKGLKFFPAKYARPKLIKGLNTVYIHSNGTTDKLFSKFEHFIIKYRKNIKDFNEILDLKPRNYLICRIHELCNIYLNLVLKPAYRIYIYLLRLIGKRK